MSYLKKHWGKIGIIFILLVISFVLSMKSGYNVFLRGGHQASDGDVFRCIGWLMTKGYVPYRDIFDHKGPFLYFIQYAATFFGQIRGIWIFEIIFITASVIISYVFARKFNKPSLSVCVVLLTFARWYECGYGNCTEEFSILFQVISIYYFTDFFLRPSNWIKTANTNTFILDEKIVVPQNKWFDFRICIAGICFACTFFMKANCCAVWIVFCSAIFIHCLRNKYHDFLKRFLLSFAVGVLIIAIPILFYLCKNDAINDFLWDYFKFNGMYSSVNGVKSKINTVIHLIRTPIWIIAFITMVFKIKRKDVSFKLDVIYMIFMLFSVMLLSMAGKFWPKMEIALIPTFIYPFAILHNLVDSRKHKNKKIIITMAGCLAGICICLMWIPQILKAIGDIDRYINHSEKMGMKTNAVVSYIRRNTKKSDKMSIFGNRCVYYLYANREPSSKYIFLPDAKVDKSILEKYFKSLKDSPPKIIIISKAYKESDVFFAKKMNTFIKEHGYKLGLKGKDAVYIRK